MKLEEQKGAVQKEKKKKRLCNNFVCANNIVWTMHHIVCIYQFCKVVLVYLCNCCINMCGPRGPPSP